MLLCPKIELTWYPGDYPSTDSPLVLLDEDHYVDDPSPLSGGSSSQIQQADYVRGEVPDFFGRGNQTTDLVFTEVRKIASPMVAQETALALLAGLPLIPGWLKIVNTGRTTTWKVVPCAIRGITYRIDARKGHLRLTWTLASGLVSILVPDEEPPVIWPDGEIELEEATPTDRVALLLEDAE